MSASSSLPNLSGVLEKLKFIISLQHQQLGLILFNFLLVILSSGTSAVIPYFTKLQIDQLEQQSPQLLSFSHSPLFVLFLLLLIPALIELIRITLFDRFQSEVTTKIGTKLKMATETIIWKKLLTLDAGFFLSQRNKKIITDCLGSSRVIEGFIRFLSSRISSVTGLLTIIPILAFVSLPLLLIISTVALLQFFLNKTVNRYKQAYSLLEHQQNDRQWRVRELLEDHTFDLIATGGFDQALSEYNKSRLLSDDLYFQSEASNRKLRAINWFLDNILFISANLFVGNQVLQGNLSIGTFTLVVSYTSLISNTLYSVLESFNEWYYIDIDLEKLQFLFSLESRLKSTKNPKPIPKDPNSL
nr:ABC transporter ATP-binding protein [Candidatus Woesebacteria bacterium]